MERGSGPGPTTVAQAWRASLRADLVAAMKSRDRPAVDALRTTIAAIDNAEAVDPADGPRAVGSGHVAGAGAGVGSTDVARRDLDTAELQRIVDGEIADRRRDADHYDDLDQADRAEHLRHQADVLLRWTEHRRP